MIDFQNFSKEEQIELLKQLLDMFIPTGKNRVSYPAFLAVMPRILSVPVELGTFNKKGEMFVRPRPENDPEYPPGGLYHSPGSILLPGETVDTVLRRIVKEDLDNQADFNRIVKLGWHRTLKGKCPGQNPTRDEVSLLHAIQIEDTSSLPQDGVWIDPFNPRVKLIPHHYAIIQDISQSSFL